MHALTDLMLPELSTKLKPGLLDEVRQRTLALCQRLGVIREDRMSVKKYLAGRFELLAALAYPDANVDALTLCNDFNTYLFYVDDQADEDGGFGKNPVFLRQYFEGHIRALREGQRVSAKDPAGLLILDIRARLLQRASQRWLERFAEDVSDYLIRGTLVSSERWMSGRVPSLAEYVEQRAWDSAMLCAQDLIEIAGAGELPTAIYQRAEFQELRRLCTNVGAFTNDLVSYTKEVRHHSSPNNILHVVMTHRHMSFEDALDYVIDLVNEDVATFETLAVHLPSFGSETDTRLARYVRSQRAWMSGNLLWSLESGRYADPQSPFYELRTATDQRSAA
jgi:hypothetical protein